MKQETQLMVTNMFPVRKRSLVGLLSTYTLTHTHVWIVKQAWRFMRRSLKNRVACLLKTNSVKCSPGHLQH